MTLHSGAIQILPEVHGFPFPTPQLSKLVRHELFFQVVIQVAHLFLGLVGRFCLIKNKGEVRVRKLLHSKRGIYTTDMGVKMCQLDAIFHK